MSFFRRLQFKIRNRWHDNSFKRSFLLLLFWLTLACLFFPLILLSMFEHDSLMFFDNMWVFYLFLPISILSIVLGTKYKKIGYRCTKNIVVGYIVSFLLIIYGSFSFIFPSMYIEDYSLVNDVEKVIDFELPNNGKIKTIEWDESSYGEFRIISTSYVTFTDDDEVNDFVSRVRISDKWIGEDSANTYFEMLKPDTIMTGLDGETYDLIYIEDLDIYNTLPSQSGIYKVYCLTYDEDNKQMEITYYYYEFNI